MMESEQCEFKGGMRQGLKNATWPDAVIRADHEVLTIRTDGGLMPDIRLDRGEVTRIRSVRGLFSRGLKFETTDGQTDKLTYWTAPLRHRVVRDALRERGWPVT